MGGKGFCVVTTNALSFAKFARTRMVTDTIVQYVQSKSIPIEIFVSSA